MIKVNDVAASESADKISAARGHVATSMSCKNYCKEKLWGRATFANGSAMIALLPGNPLCQKVHSDVNTAPQRRAASAGNQNKIKGLSSQSVSRKSAIMCKHENESDSHRVGHQTSFASGFHIASSGVKSRKIFIEFQFVKYWDGGVTIFNDNFDGPVWNIKPVNMSQSV